MRVFLCSLVIFLSSLYLIDRGYGLCCDWLNVHPRRGETYYREYVVNRSTDDVIMYGSSRMLHHYVSDIIADSLNMSVWNAGVDGMGIIMNYGYLELMLRHHKPNLILYDLSPYDFLKEDNIKQLKNLRPYSDNPGIRSIIEDVDKRELFKLQSYLFRYNSSFLPLLRDFFKEGGKGAFNGYSPLAGKMQADVYPDKVNRQILEHDIDSIKVAFLERFIERCRQEGIDLLFLNSPEFCSEPSSFSIRLGEFVRARSIPFLNYSYTDEISNNPALFQDKEHLNNEGAEVFSKVLSKHLRVLFSS